MGYIPQIVYLVKSPPYKHMGIQTDIILEECNVMNGPELLYGWSRDDK